MPTRPPRTPESAAAKLRSTRIGFRVYLAATSLLVVFFLYLSGSAVLNNHYRNDPDTQTVTATVTGTKRDCTKSGCYYDSYGNYALYGVREQNVKIVWLSRQPVAGQVVILANPKRPHMAMPAYYNPYPGQAVFAGTFAGLFVIWNSFLYFVLYRRSQKKLAALART